MPLSAGVAHGAALQIASARLWPAQEYTRLILESAAPIEYQLVMLKQPNRVVLDLARVDATPELGKLASRVQGSDPYIASIRVGTPSGGFLRVVLDVKSEVNPQVFALKPVAEFGHRLVVDLYPPVPLDPLMALLESESRRGGGGVHARAAPASRRSEGRDTVRRVEGRDAVRRIEGRDAARRIEGSTAVRGSEGADCARRGRESAAGCAAGSIARAAGKRGTQAGAGGRRATHHDRDRPRPRRRGSRRRRPARHLRKARRRWRSRAG